EISRLKRKYGDSLDAVLDHLRVSEERLANIETAEFRAEELEKQLSQKADEYRKQAARLHERRAEAAKNLEKQVVNDLRSVDLEKAQFEVRIERTETFGPDGADRIEFFFSA